ncbi:hypothetical protein IV203_013884 [Nitzschia inconspicua]|uniref:Uncharacterized protein n=1 Tax=Nitzschia inconspicua TaxID=303405 RepID=A0A9K3QAE4_9STRA|nr:hypothetical protein IV203_013884 [Nitzschia inconspicua]
MIVPFVLCLALALGTSIVNANNINYLLQTNALNYQDNFEVDTEIYGHCIAGTPESNLKADTQTTRYDEKCKELGPCHIGFTQKGEWVAYDFYHSDKDIAYTNYEGTPVILVNVTIRVSAPGPRTINLEIDDAGNEFRAGATKIIYGKGYHQFEDVVWENVEIQPYNPHRLWVYFWAGNTNLCSVTISSQRAARPIPFSINALEYDAAFEVDTEIYGNCIEGQPPVTEPDAQTTLKDAACQALGPCHIAFVQPQEYVVYRFAHSNEWIVRTKSGENKVFVDITVRVASLKPRLFTIELEYDGLTSSSQSFWSIGLGWQEFQDVTFRMVSLDPTKDIHSVIVRFEEGSMNLCSITVEYSKQEPEVTWSALEYSYDYRQYPVVMGACLNLGDDVAVFSNSDEMCLDRDGSFCRITPDPAPYLSYIFHVRSDEDFDIWVRAAAQYPKTTMRMEMRPAGQDVYDATFEIFSADLDDFKDVVWENLYLEENEYELRIYLQSYQTLCSVAVKRSTSRYYVHVPGTYTATFYVDAFDATAEVYGNCPYVNYLYSGVDALIVDDDPECAAAISEHNVACAIGWTDVNESLSYGFVTDGVHEYVNLSFRVSSRSKNRRMKVQLFWKEETEYIITGPGRGWNEYETFTLENVYVGSAFYHIILVTFLDGQMNLCSFGIEYGK